jgi:hypothetical protein
VRIESAERRLRVRVALISDFGFLSLQGSTPAG